LTSSDAENPGSRNVADVAALVLDEAGRAFDQTEGGAWALDGAVLGQTDPRDAAAIDDWQSFAYEDDLVWRLSPFQRTS
jgi:hypothetical protein